VSDSFFLPTGDACTWQPTEATVGPWSPRLQHGGPPAALMVRQAERLAADVVSGPADALRLSLDFLGPVSTDPVVLGGTVVRTGRSVTLVDVTLSQGGRAALHARVWLLRRAPEGTTPTVPGRAPEHPDPDSFGPSALWDFPYARHLDWRAVGGTLVGSGPAQVWVRPRVPVVPGERPTSLQQAALVGDSGSGVSAELDWDQWSFLNVDLDLHLLRPVQDDWLLLDARTRLASTGTGLSATTLHDRGGACGTIAQTLLVSPRG
jgi:acyl-CoA thioesterase